MPPNDRVWTLIIHGQILLAAYVAAQPICDWIR